MKTDWILLLERVFFPTRHAERRRLMPELERIASKHNIDLADIVTRDSATIAAEVAANTGTPLPLDLLRFDPHPDLVKRARGEAAFATMLFAAMLLVTIISAGEGCRYTPESRDPRSVRGAFARMREAVTAYHQIRRT